MHTIIKKLLSTKRNARTEKGVALLFAVMLTSVLFLVAIGISNIAYKEVSFSIEARDSDLAFFAADTGAECGLFLNSQDPTLFQSITGPSFDLPGGPDHYTCDNINPLHITGIGGPGGVSHFAIPLNGNKQCVEVAIDTRNHQQFRIDPTTGTPVYLTDPSSGAPLYYTIITSRGYNAPKTGTDTCFPPIGATPINLVSRVLQITLTP